MIVTPEEAVLLNCCAMEKNCIGPMCMAWQKEMKAPDEISRSVNPHGWAKPVETGRGFCGLARR